MGKSLRLIDLNSKQLSLVDISQVEDLKDQIDSHSSTARRVCLSTICCHGLVLYRYSSIIKLSVIISTKPLLKMSKLPHSLLGPLFSEFVHPGSIRRLGSRSLDSWLNVAKGSGKFISNILNCVILI